MGGFAEWGSAEGRGGVCFAKETKVFKMIKLFHTSMISDDQVAAPAQDAAGASNGAAASVLTTTAADDKKSEVREYLYAYMWSKYSYDHFLRFFIL
jgi:hypothetical protein